LEPTGLAIADACAAAEATGRTALVGRQTCVVHGDPNPRKIRVTADRVALTDWTSCQQRSDFDLNPTD
jgi:hypothetical protein